MSKTTAQEFDWYEGTCAIVEAGGMRGTAYLVSPDLMATCSHVAGREGAGAKVTFPWGEIDATIVSVHPELDAALLRLSKPVLSDPLRLRIDRARGVTWESYGFPKINAPHGMMIKGSVINDHATDREGQSAFQLESHQHEWPEGLSGAPVVVGGAVVGHITLKLVEPGTGRGTMSTLWACPASAVKTLLRGLSPAQPAQAPDAPGFSYNDGVCYVHRPAEEDRVLRYLRDEHRPVVLTGPEHFGKSYLLGHILATLKRGARGDMHVVTASIASFAAFLPAGKAPDGAAFLEWLIEQWLNAFCPPDLDGEIELSRWTTKRRLSWTEKLSGFVKEHIARAPEARFVFVLERVGLLHEFPEIRNSFFALLREWADWVGLRKEPWARLSLIAESSTAATLTSWAKEAAFSPFNTVPPIPVEELDLDQAEDLAAHHGLSWSREDIRRLMEHVGGHPYLLRMAMHEASRRGGLHAEVVIEDAAGAKGMFEWYLENLFWRIIADEALARVLQRIVFQNGTVDDRWTAERLAAAGIIQHKPRSYGVRFAIYQAFLKRRLDTRGT